MGNESFAAAEQVLLALALAQQRLGELRERVQRRAEVLTAVQDFTLCKYQNRSGPTAELYVDVELRNGRCITWFLELYWDEGSCVVASNVYVIRDERGQDTMKEFAERTATRVDEIVQHIAEATSDLISSIDCLDEVIRN